MQEKRAIADIFYVIFYKCRCLFGKNVMWLKRIQIKYLVLVIKFKGPYFSSPERNETPLPVTTTRV